MELFYLVRFHLKYLEKSFKSLLNTWKKGKSWIFKNGVETLFIIQ